MSDQRSLWQKPLGHQRVAGIALDVEPWLTNPLLFQFLVHRVSLEREASRATPAPT